MSRTQQEQIDRALDEAAGPPRAVSDAGGVICLAIAAAVLLACFAADAWALHAAGSGAAAVVTGVAPLAGVVGGGMVAAAILVASRARNIALLAAGYVAAAGAVFLVALPVFLFG